MLASTSLPVFERVAYGGHAIKNFIPLRSRSAGDSDATQCYKAGYLQFTLQFLPGQQNPSDSPPGKKKIAEEKGRETVYGGSSNQSGGVPTLAVKVECARGIRCPGWPGRKEPFVDVQLLITENNVGGGRKISFGEQQCTDLAISDGQEGSAADFMQTLMFNIPPAILSRPLASQGEPAARPILLLRMKGSARLSESAAQNSVLSGAVSASMRDDEFDSNGARNMSAAIIGECRIPVPWSVLLHGKKQRRWHSLRKSCDMISSASEAELLNPAGVSGVSRGELRITLSASGVDVRSNLDDSHIIGEPEDLDLDEFEEDDYDDDGSHEEQLDSYSAEREKLLKKMAGAGPGLLIVQVTNLEVSRSGERIGLKPQSITLSFNNATTRSARKESEIEAENISPKIPEYLTTSSPSRHSKGKSKGFGELVSSLEVEMNENVKNQSRPICLPVPFAAKGTVMSVKLSASHGLAFYNSEIEVATATSAPGIELEEWTSLVPATEPLTGLQVGDTPERSLGRPAIGRARLRLRYLPHTAGTVKIRLRDLNLAEYISRQSKSRNLFVRARVIPGGSWVCSTLHRNVDTKTTGRLSFGGEALRLDVDTSALQLRPEGVVPGVELCVFDNSSGLLYNTIGVGTLPLTAILSRRYSSNDVIGGGDFCRVLLLDELGGKGAGLNGADIIKDAGGLDVAVEYKHLRTPASAIGSEEGDFEGSSLPLSRVIGIAGAEAQLKNLFYKLDLHKTGFVQKKDLLSCITGATSSPWGRLLAELRGVKVSEEDVQGKDTSEGRALSMLDFNAAEEISRVFNVHEGVSLSGDTGISWEQWLSYLETLRVNGPKNAGGVDLGLIRRNLQLARYRERDQKMDDLVGQGSPNRTSRTLKRPPRSKTRGDGNTWSKNDDATGSWSKDGTEIPRSAPTRQSYPSALPSDHATIAAPTLLIGAERVVIEGPPSSPAKKNFLGMMPASMGRNKRHRRDDANIDPVSRLPLTESDYKRLDAEQARKRLRALQKEEMLKEAGVEVEELQVKNARLRTRLKNEMEKARVAKTGVAVEQGRARRLLNAEIELATKAKNIMKELEDSGNRSRAMHEGGDRGTNDENVSAEGAAKLLHLEQVNEMLKKCLAKYQEEFRSATEKINQMEKMGEESHGEDSSRNVQARFSEERFKNLSEQQVEADLEVNRLGMELESLKAENIELRTEKLTLARRAGRAVDSERTASASLAIERRRTSQLNSELERARQVIAAHEREALHRNAEQKLVVLAAARDRARRAADARSKLAIKNSQDYASRVLQNRVKGWKAKKEFQREREKVVKVQSLARSASAKKKYKSRLIRESSAARILQRRVRGTSARKGKS